MPVPNSEISSANGPLKLIIKSDPVKLPIAFHRNGVKFAGLVVEHTGNDHTIRSLLHEAVSCWNHDSNRRKFGVIVDWESQNIDWNVIRLGPDICKPRVVLSYKLQSFGRNLEPQLHARLGQGSARRFALSSWYEEILVDFKAYLSGGLKEWT